MQTIANVVHITIFGYIVMTRDLIGYDSLVDYGSLTDYACFVIQKITDKMMINLDAKEFATCVNIAEIFTVWERSFEFY